MERRGHWQSEEEVGLYSWPRSTYPIPHHTTRLSRNTSTLSRPDAETSSHPKKNIHVVEDMLARKEAPERERGWGAGK